MSKTVLISGASSGIGLAIAKQFKQNGYHVVAICRQKPMLDIDWIACDLTLKSERERVIQQIKNISRIDILINNAGVGLFNTWEESQLVDIRYLMELNYFSVIELTQSVLEKLKKHQGTIINISSVAGRVSLACMGAYCASKHAVEAFSNSLRIEMVPYSVRVLNVVLGRISTGFSTRALGSHFVPQSSSRVTQADRVSQVLFQAYLKKKKNIIYPMKYRFMLMIVPIFPRLFLWFNLKKWKL